MKKLLFSLLIIKATCLKRPCSYRVQLTMPDLEPPMPWNLHCQNPSYYISHVCTIT